MSNEYWREIREIIFQHLKMNVFDLFWSVTMCKASLCELQYFY